MGIEQVIFTAAQVLEMFEKVDTILGHKLASTAAKQYYPQLHSPPLPDENEAMLEARADAYQYQKK